ncbi:GNAT family N-acetyltransferase [Paenibacillus sepulcri]|uniref:GNAT family N-acetyltransferase n=1 Tax=Paenibacillus sepulcri TaxID=359917 RepID=A0ABS7C796_9BACL|nr:GNAT family N-acetyltransferase [Paenibacillus sepulcri]
MKGKHPVIQFGGSKVGLGPLRAEYIELYYRWNRHFVHDRNIDKPDPLTPEEQEEAFRDFSSNPRYIFFTIYDKEPALPVGIAYLEREDALAEFAIIIGEEQHQGRGIGTEAAQLVLDYAFTVLGLRQVSLVVDESNPGAIQAYKKAGFKEEGKRAPAGDIDGQASYQLTMSCQAADFVSPVLKDLLGKRSIKPESAFGGNHQD